MQISGIQGISGMTAGELLARAMSGKDTYDNRKAFAQQSVKQLGSACSFFQCGEYVYLKSCSHCGGNAEMEKGGEEGSLSWKAACQMCGKHTGEYKGEEGNILAAQEWNESN